MPSNRCVDEIRKGIEANIAKFVYYDSNYGVGVKVPKGPPWATERTLAEAVVFHAAIRPGARRYD